LQAFQNLIHPDDSDRVNKAVEMALNKEKPYNAEFRIVRKGGTERVIHSQAEVEFDEKGSPVRMFGVASDITERKRAEDALKESIDFIKLLQGISSQANESQSIDETLQFCIDKICALTSWPVGHIYMVSGDNPDRLEPTSIWCLENEARYRVFHDITMNADFIKGTGLPGRVLATGKPAWIFDVTLDSNFPRARAAQDIGVKAGFAFPILVRDEVAALLEFYYPEAMEPNDQLLEIMAQIGTQAGRVIERKRAEEKLRLAMNKLAKANEEMKSFTNIVSHDLRSPLVNMKGFSGELKSSFETLKDILNEVSPRLTEEQNRLIEAIMREEVPEAFSFIDSSANAMEKLVSSIMALARIGERKLNYSEVNIGRLIDEKLKSMHHQIEEKNVEVKVNGLPSVVADEMCMDQIFGNILSNAIKYLDPDRPGIIEISGERRTNDTLFKVEDNGTGIPDYAREKVFQIFRRGVGKEIPGDGMGLAFVKALIERHDGETWFESQEGVGTTFYFTITNNLKPIGKTDGQA
jgi:signal transduction histidine kinase